MPATTLLPIGAIAVSIVAYYYPALLSDQGGLIVPLLGLVMLGMGMTLTPRNFFEILKRPRLIAVGTGLQFLLMPLLGWLLSEIAGLPPELVIGLVLVGACPGGTASNVICYLARGDVALSITLTTVSTLVSVVLTPVMTWLYLGQMIAVPVVEMMSNIFRIILLPVCVGVCINYCFHNILHGVRKLFPYISVIAIILIIGIIVARTGEQLSLLALPLLAVIFWHNLLGMCGGYYAGRLLGYKRRVCRTLAIEVGMQNSGMAIALVQLDKFPVLAALPGALFSIWHNISGSILASVWARRSPRPG
ncbi:MAG: bile acid:sodium symporter family protein [Gammaproteobacteria bacterium]